MKLSFILAASVSAGLIGANSGSHLLSRRSPERLAAPTVIIFTGNLLPHRVVLTDWNENLRLMLAAGNVVRVSAESLRTRPRINVAMFWGQHWKTRSVLPDSVSALAAADGAQSGTLYPKYRGREAVWIFGPAGAMPSSVRALQPEGLAILVRHGIPAVAE